MRCVVSAACLLLSCSNAPAHVSQCDEFELGSALRSDGRWDEAARALSEAVASSSPECIAERSAAVAMLAGVLAFQGQNLIAIELLEESLATSPAEGFDRRPQLLASLLLNEGRASEAAEILRHLAEASAESESLHTLQRITLLKNLARASTRAGDDVGAQRAYRTAVELLESEGSYFYASDVRSEWAKVLEDSGRIEKAREQFEEIFKNASSDPHRATEKSLIAYVEFLEKYGPKDRVPVTRRLLDQVSAIPPPGSSDP